MTWLTPWHQHTNPAAAEAELARELSGSHVLANVPVTALACRQDQDDVLFQLNDGSGRVAVLHLTYRKESAPDWPFTTLFGSLEEFSAGAMAQDHADNSNV